MSKYRYYVADNSWIEPRCITVDDDYKDHINDFVEWESPRGSYKSKCTVKEWRAWKANAREVPGLLWHLRYLDACEGKLKQAEDRVKSARWTLQYYLEAYSTAMETALVDVSKEPKQPCPCNQPTATDISGTPYCVACGAKH